MLIVDARHESQPSDREALGFLGARGRRVVVAATKMDKLAKSRRFGATRAIARGLGIAASDVVPFSAVEGTGTDALWARVAGLVKEARGAGRAAPSLDIDGEP